MLRALRLTAVAVLAIVVAGCGGPATPSRGGSAAPPPPPVGPAVCHTGQLSARLGDVGPAPDGQRVVPLIYTNVSTATCTLRGAPDVELHGPDDPNGPVFEMSARNSPAATVVLRPGGSATAKIVLTQDSQGRTGHGGSTGWTPTELVSTPPGETATITTAWTEGGTVLREDSSTHPDEYVLPFQG